MTSINLRLLRSTFTYQLVSGACGSVPFSLPLSISQGFEVPGSPIWNFASFSVFLGISVPAERRKCLLTLFRFAWQLHGHHIQVQLTNLFHALDCESQTSHVPALPYLLGLEFLDACCSQPGDKPFSWHFGHMSISQQLQWK